MPHPSHRRAKSPQSREAPLRHTVQKPARARRRITGWLVFGALLAVGLLLVMWQPGQLLSQTPLLAAVPLVIGVAVFAVWRWGGLLQYRKSDIQCLDWAQFQPLLCQFLEKQGYSLSESGNRPGIVDLVVRKDRQTFLVHAKSWKSSKVGVDVVSQLYAAMISRGVGFGIVIGGSKFGRSAQGFARETQIQLIDGASLQQWFAARSAALARRKAEQGRPTVPEPQSQAMDTQNLPEFSPVSTHNEPLVPQCPLCDAPMRQRKARKGRHAGRMFWGCTRHPQCKGLRRLA